jgi:hypothetical protein
MSLTNSTTSCFRDQVQTYNASGMSGLVCAASGPPAILDISPCCNGEPRVENNCTQFCEATDINTFGRCVNRDVNSSVDAYFAMCANASSAEGDEDKPEENGAGEFLVCFFCHCQIWLSLV